MSPIINLLNVIVRNFLANSYCLAIFSDLSIDLDPIVPMVSYKTDNLNKTILATLDMGCSDFIVRMKDPNVFLDVFDESIHITNQRRGTRKLIFVPEVSNEENRQILYNVLKSYALNFVPDMLLILPKDCDLEKNTEDTLKKFIQEEPENCSVYDIGTHKFVGKDDRELLLLDTWNDTNSSFSHNANLFPDKLINLQGRTVKIATFSYKPYSILEVDENDKITGLDGTEMKAAIEFCRWSNCSIEIIRDDEHEWGEIWDNRTGNGILGNIVTDRADFGYGALYSWYHEFLFLDLTMPIVRTGITCIAPEPLLLPRWLLPILPFNKLMWSTVFVSIVIGSIGMFITARRAKKPFTVTESIMGTFGILLLQVPPVNKPPIHLRSVMSWLLLLSLLVSNIYSSGLASTMTVPKYEDPIDTVQDLVDSNLDWGATHDAWIFSILLSTDPNIMRLVDKFKKWSEKRLESKGRTRDFAYSVERLPAGHFAIGEYVTEESVPYLQLMQQDIYWEQCVFMARKSSPYTRRINTFFSRLHQSGLPHSWETQVVLKHANYKVQLAVKLSLGKHGGGSHDPRPLGVKHFQGPIFLWCLGIVFACVTFVIEVFSGCFKIECK